MNNSGDGLSLNNRDNESETWFLDERIKRLLLDLQRHWLMDYQAAREKALVDLSAKLHQDFMEDQNRTRNELMTQFREELENTRAQLERKHQEAMAAEIDRLNERFQRDIQATKRKQWCSVCENEAIYFCCWNTSYCSTECQQRHWASHRRTCRRRTRNQ